MIGGEQVVEVVRDAAGEPADGLHLLRLAELLLELHLRGDVALHADVVGDAPGASRTGEMMASST